MEVFSEDVLQDIEEVFSDCDDCDYIEVINFSEVEEDETQEEEGNISTIETHAEQLYGRNGRAWSTRCSPVTQPRIADIVREKQGIPSRFAQDILSPIDAFQQIISSDIIDIIVRATNRKAADFFEKNPVSGCRPWKDTNSRELYSFIGLLIHAGACKSWDEELVDLWKTDNRPIYRATMSLKRFQQLLRFLRFDDFRTRQERLASDKIAAVRDIWDMFQSRLKDIYKPSAYLTVDEQLVTTRGRCSFRQYLLLKPGKYGIKIFWCCDATNSYPLKGEIYIGRQPNADRAQNYAMSLVNRITGQWLRKGRSITMDNFFTSVELAEQMLTQNTTIVGTLRKNKADIPKELLAVKGRQAETSIFCFNKDLTLVSYIPKKGKNVIMLSTLHHTSEVDPEQKNKPFIIVDYNRYEGGVDTLDQLVSTYICKRKTYRWSMTLFYNMIDVASVAAYNLYNMKFPNWSTRTTKRKLFLQKLGRELVDPLIVERLANPNIRKGQAACAIRQMGYSVIEVPEMFEPSSSRKRLRCAQCPRSNDRKVNTFCKSCKKPTCKEHSSIICCKCISAEEDHSENEMDSD